MTRHDIKATYDEGLTLENSAFYPLRWPIYVFNSVFNTKLPVILSHRRSTPVSLETYPLSFIHLNVVLHFNIFHNLTVKTTLRGEITYSGHDTERIKT